jgi:hypothetical protein
MVTVLLVSAACADALSNEVAPSAQLVVTLMEELPERKFSAASVCLLASSSFPQEARTAVATKAEKMIDLVFMIFIV